MEELELRRRWLCSPVVQAFERGQISPEQFVTQFISEWQLTVTPEQFLKAFASWPRGLYPGALELLDALRNRYRLAVLSNSNAVHWDRILEIQHYFERVYSSHLLGIVKPDLLIFERVRRELGTGAEGIWFFDDSPANVEAARSAGLTAYRTDGVEDLTQTLRALDLLPEGMQSLPR